MKTAEEKIAQALALMDRSMYGNPEVPFQMRAILEGGYGGYNAEGELNDAA